MKARVSHLYKTAEEWKKWASWKPNAGELIIYQPDEQFPYTRIQVGDGEHTLQELEELGYGVGSDQSGIIDGGRITDYTK